MKKSFLKIIGWVLGISLVAFISLFAYSYYWGNYKYLPSENIYTERIAFIDSKNSLLSENFETCNDYIFDYYNPKRATYSEGKNGLRKFILSNYKNKGYIDSGYLNFRFVINCKGESGRYVVYENNLDLEPHKFNQDLVKQLFDLTVQLKKWNPNFTHNEYRDSYMYISYRIENGEITEIIP